MRRLSTRRGVFPMIVKTVGPYNSITLLPARALYTLNCMKLLIEAHQPHSAGSVPRNAVGFSKTFGHQRPE